MPWAQEQHKPILCVGVSKKGAGIEKLRGPRGVYNHWTEQPTFNNKCPNIVINPITCKRYSYFWKPSPE